MICGCEHLDLYIHVSGSISSGDKAVINTENHSLGPSLEVDTWRENTTVAFNGYGRFSSISPPVRSNSEPLKFNTQT
jgi:hypothetical protein